MFYGIEEVVGTIKVGSHPGQRVIATRDREIEVRGTLAKSLPANTAGHGVIYHRLGFARLVAFGDTSVPAGEYFFDRFAAMALVIFAVVSGYFLVQAHWLFGLVALAVVALAITDLVHTWKVTRRLEAIQQS